MTTTEVRRDEDWELMGYVRRDGDQWAALTVFGGLLDLHPTEDEARHTVETCGLSSMAEPWHVRIDDRWWPCQLQEARPAHVRLWVTAHDYPESTRTVQLENPRADVLRLHSPKGH
ncbi:MAG: hypothetical protein ACRDT0_18710 [Pseudonocardiaceae bacterium]